MGMYIVEIADVMPAMIVEFPAAGDEDAARLAARIVKGHVDELPLDNLVSMRRSKDAEPIITTTVEGMARSTER